MTIREGFQFYIGPSVSFGVLWPDPDFERIDDWFFFTTLLVSAIQIVKSANNDIHVTGNREVPVFVFIDFVSFFIHAIATLQIRSVGSTDSKIISLAYKVLYPLKRQTQFFTFTHAIFVNVYRYFNVRNGSVRLESGCYIIFGTDRLILAYSQRTATAGGA